MPRYHRIDKPASFDGHWWLPERPGDRIAGRFAFDPKDGLTLSLLGCFAEDSGGPAYLRQLTHTGEYSQIYGSTISGEAIVLLSCFTTRFDVANEMIIANKALVSSHVPTPPAPVRAIRLGIRNLEYWTGAQPLKSHVDQLSARETGPIVSYSPPSHSLARGHLPKSGGRVFIRNLTSLTSTRLKESVCFRARIDLMFRERPDFDKALGIASSTERLLSLLMGTPAVSKYETYSFPTWNADCLYRSWSRVRPRDIEHHSTMPCAFPQITDEFVAILDNWLAMPRELGTVVNLLFSCLYKANTFMEVDFADCAHALDTYSTIEHNSAYLDETEYEALESRMLQLIHSSPAEYNKSFRERAKSYLRFMNRPSMRTRLKRLLKSTDPVIVKNCLGDAKINRFTDYVVDIRNLLAHPDSGDVWTKTTHGEFRETLGRLKLLLIVLVLQSAGVPLKVLQTSYNDYRLWQWGS